MPPMEDVRWRTIEKARYGFIARFAEERQGQSVQVYRTD